MKKLIFILLIFACSVASNAFSETNDLSNVDTVWKNQLAAAFMSVNVEYPDGTSMNHNLIINYDKTRNCKGEFGVSMLDGGGYGKLTNSLIKKGFLKLYIDEILVYDDDVFEATYSNGRELLAPASNELIQKLKYGKKIRIELTDIGSVIFSLKNARNAIENAYKKCTN